MEEPASDSKTKAKGRSLVPWGPYVQVIVAAVAAAGLVLGLSDRVLLDLAPPTIDAQLVVRFATLIVAALLMIILGALSPKLTRGGRRRLMNGCLLLIMALVVFYLGYRFADSEFVYSYPPGQEAPKQRKHVRGVYSESGMQIASGLSPAAAVARAGGTEAVERTDVLWRAGSHTQVGHALVAAYIALIVLTTSTLFLCAFAVLTRKPKK